jgi:LPXTG-motif cell wall-anchored protein
VWFYATIVGAPLLVLLFGLSFVFWRRRQSSRRA